MKKVECLQDSQASTGVSLRYDVFFGEASPPSTVCWDLAPITHPPGHVSIANGCLAGAAAGFTQVTATNPMEIVKVQQQVGRDTSRRGSNAYIPQPAVLSRPWPIG